MARTKIGKISVTPRGAYSSTIAYERLDIVKYDGCSFLCLKNCTGVDTSNTEYWQEIAHKGEFTEHDKQEFKEAVVETSKQDINDYTNEKKTELDNKETTLENDMTSKKNELVQEINTYTAEKKNELDNKETTLEADMTAKKDELVQQISDAQDGFDDNVETKTNEFDEHADDRKSELQAISDTARDFVRAVTFTTIEQNFETGCLEVNSAESMGNMGFGLNYETGELEVDING